MGAQAKGNMADPRQRQMINEGMQTNQQRSQEQAMVEREQQQAMVERDQQQRNQRDQQQAFAERMQKQREQSTQEVGIGNYERDQQQRNQLDQQRFKQAMVERDERDQQQAFAERMQKQQEEQQRAENTPTPGTDGPGSSNREAFDLDKFNRLKAEVDQQRSRNNSGIAFGPGRSTRTQYRGNIDLGDLGRELQKRRQRR